MRKARNASPHADLPPPANSLLGIMKALNPDWEFGEWFHWPPDIFALTSLILKATGAYRFVAVPPAGGWPEQEDWQDAVNQAATQWWPWIAGGDELPELVADGRRVLEEHQRTTLIEHILQICRRAFDKEKEEDVRAWSVCRALLKLHAVADQACRGFGLPHAEDDNDRSSMTFLANMLLVATGTLSRLPKYKVMVLPKMRTPQVGLTLRSLSHHVTVHQCEVDVVWRSMPWVNSDEDTINLMIVPWPRRIDQTWFRPGRHCVNRQSDEPGRFFTFQRGDDERLPVDRVVAMLTNCTPQVNRVHLLVFPELALDAKELHELQSALAGELPRNRMPMILAGLREEGTGAKLGRNQVVLSFFFAGKWYDLVQDKHHRWKLDGSQIRQYNLGGVLSSSRDWWEAIDLPDRRIAFLAPNGWLALCPLICEDLGRLEPVSELIRGVGPTLLIAILLDGPQLPQRWSGRYASVLADDPGTAVLTLTSLGMVQCSNAQQEKAAVPVIGLWKDPLTGWREIRMGDDEDAKVLTITAQWMREYTADGRGDNGAAAAFSLQGVHSVRAGEVKPAHRRSGVLTGEFSDLRDLAIYTFLADAALGIDHRTVNRLGAWARGHRAVGDNWLEKDFRPKDTIWLAIHDALYPGGVETVSPAEEKRLQDFEYFVKELSKLVQTVKLREPQEDYWDDLVREAEKVLAAAKYHPTHLTKDDVPAPLALRLQIYAALAILWAVHMRVAERRRHRGLSSRTEDLLNYIERLLEPRYDDEWYQALAAE